MRIALYRGKKRLFNRLVAWWTRSAYSHCEIVFADDPNSGLHYCASASHLDGGVRFKWLDLHPDTWDIVDVQGDEGVAYAWFLAHQGRSYDFKGIVGCVLRCIPASADKWFCSSAIAAAIGWPEPWRVVPANLKNAADFRGGVVHG